MSKSDHPQYFGVGYSPELRAAAAAFYEAARAQLPREATLAPGARDPLIVESRVFQFAMSSLQFTAMNTLRNTGEATGQAADSIADAFCHGIGRAIGTSIGPFRPLERVEMLARIIEYTDDTIQRLDIVMSPGGTAGRG